MRKARCVPDSIYSKSNSEGAGPLMIQSSSLAPGITTRFQLYRHGPHVHNFCTGSCFVEDHAEDAWNPSGRYPGLPDHAETSHPHQRSCSPAPLLHSLFSGHPIPAQRHQIFGLPGSPDSVYPHVMPVPRLLQVRTACHPSPPWPRRMCPSSLAPFPFLDTRLRWSR